MTAAFPPPPFPSAPPPPPADQRTTPAPMGGMTMRFPAPPPEPFVAAPPGDEAVPLPSGGMSARFPPPLAPRKPRLPDDPAVPLPAGGMTAAFPSPFPPLSAPPPEPAEPPRGVTAVMPSPIAPPPARPSTELPPPGAGMTALFPSPFSAPPPFQARAPEPAPVTAMADDAAPEVPAPPAPEPDESPFAAPPPPLAADPVLAPPPPPSAPLGFGEVDLGAPPAVLGHADEPFPFETPQLEPSPVPPGSERAPAATESSHESHEPVAPPEDPFAPDPLTTPMDPFALPPAKENPFARGPAVPDEASFADVQVGIDAPESGARAGDAARSAPAPEEPLGALGGLGALGAKETEELEMLFDEEAARGARPSAAVPEALPSPTPDDASGEPSVFKVRRRSGKVFGPFTEAEVVQMLSKGELLGNEDVSADDGVTFGAIGTIAAFGDAMRRLMEAPGPVSGPRLAKPPKPEDLATRRPKVTATSRVVERVRGTLRTASAGRWFKPALAAAAAAAVLAVGLGAGLTQYGVFFYRVALGQTGANRPGAKLLAQARSALVQDGYAGVKGAVDLSDRALRIQPSDREAKAVYAYAASLLVRRHGGGAEAWARARTFLPELAAKLADDAEAAKALVSASLLSGERPADAAAAVLQRHLVKSPRDEDALLVLGDAALARGDLVQAAALYGRLDPVGPGAPRAAHALGTVAVRRGDAAGARKHFEAALAQDAGHLASAVELARLAVATGDFARAEQLARRVVATEAQGLAGPAERAGARAVLGLALARTSGDDPEKRLAAAEKELEAAVKEDHESVAARVTLAEFQLDRHAPDKASTALQPLLGVPREPRVLDLQARALAAQGKVLDALTLVDGALQKWPADPRLLYAKGVVAQLGGKRADAEKLWSDAAARDPASWEPHLALGQARLARAELDEAEKELKLAAEKAPPGEGEAISGLADVRLARKDLAGAEAGYRRALGVDPAQAEAHLGLARVALARGDAASAEAELGRALRLDPRLGPAHTARGELLWKTRDLPGARQAFQAAVAIDPRDAAARGRLGAVELESGGVDAAVADLLTASNLEMTSAEIRGWYGRALLAKGEIPQAIEQLRKAVDIEPRNAQHQLDLGQALERAGTPQEAIDAYRAAQALAPDRIEPYEAQAALYAFQNRCGDALPLLDKAAALAPREQRLRVAAADCKMRLGKYADASAAYRRALQADPRLVPLYYKIARAEHEGAGRAAALPWYERAAREEPRNPMPHYYLGFAYKERGQQARAIQAFRAYLGAKPDAEDRKDIEREIEDLGGRP